ncbi:hypothetical protein [Arthrobacter sp. Z1-15]
MQNRVLTAELRDDTMADAVVSAAIEHFETLDGLVNNAIKPPSPFTSQTANEFELSSSTGPRRPSCS